MKHILLAILGVGFILSGATSAKAADELPKRPNIFFIFTDDQRWDTLHSLGNPQCQTPTFDRLVNEGFRFNNAFCQGSMIGAVCLPSRTMLATGRSLWHIPPNLRSKTAPPGVPLLPALLNDAGYVTYHCGKSGNACLYSNAMFQTNIVVNNRDADTATVLATNAIEFLQKHDGAKPFFMYLAPPVPHDPRLAPPQFVKMYDPASIILPKQFMPAHPFDPGVLDIRDEKLAAYPRTEAEMKQHLADYYATISHLDYEVGQILDVVRQRGWEKNTIILFSSDQGLACGGYHGLMGKQNLYEDVKPPLVLAGPGIPHGQSDALTYLYDLFPTICDLARIKTPAVAEGKSLLPVAFGKETRLREYLFGAFETVQRMVRDEQWKLYAFNVKGEKHTLLFNLREDPAEVHSLADDPKFAAERTRLEQKLAQLRKEFDDPVDFDGDGHMLVPAEPAPAKKAAVKP